MNVKKKKIFQYSPYLLGLWKLLIFRFDLEPNFVDFIHIRSRLLNQTTV